MDSNELLEKYEKALEEGDGFVDPGQMFNEAISYCQKLERKLKEQSDSGIGLIAEERQRQIEEEGFTSEHDNQYRKGELSDAAAYYAFTDFTIEAIDHFMGNDMHLHFWPFDINWIKRTPNNRIRELQKAGALIAAEIDRLKRAEE